jgi:hypothetical protein
MATGANEFSDNGPGSGMGDDHKIHFFVDGEPVETDKEKLTVNQIIKDFGGQDPATHYLVQIGPPRVSFQGKGDETIEVHEGEKFQIISIGPTTVS